MITICLTYRDRDINIVKNALDSLKSQTNHEFEVFFIDYGSSKEYQKAIGKIIEEYDFINYYYFNTIHQLWNKSKAINFALKQCKSNYFFVGDVDMIFRNDFIEKLKKLKSDSEAVYFKVGYLSKEESSLKKDFSKYNIHHYSNEQATGMTLYPKHLLMEINGYDEYCHGWGLEDTDVHLRLKNNGINVKFIDEVYMLHQWHPKIYRSKNSSAPYHTKLERINLQYSKQVIALKKIKANQNYEWGIVNHEEEHKGIQTLKITNQKSEIEAFCLQYIQTDKILEVNFVLHKEFKSLKNVAKILLRKKQFEFYTLDEVNNKVLELLILQYRNHHYEYFRNKNDIKIIIYPSKFSTK